MLFYSSSLLLLPFYVIAVPALSCLYTSFKHVVSLSYKHTASQSRFLFLPAYYLKLTYILAYFRHSPSPAHGVSYLKPAPPSAYTRSTHARVRAARGIPAHDAGFYDRGPKGEGKGGEGGEEGGGPTCSTCYLPNCTRHQRVAAAGAAHAACRLTGIVCTPQTCAPPGVTYLVPLYLKQMCPHV